MMNWFLTATTVALLGACASAPAPYAALDGESAHGEAAPAFTHLSWPEVDAAVKSGAVLVDARGADSYAQGHIAGAINVPAGDEQAMSQLPPDKSTQLVFYCGGPACNASTKAAQQAAARGYARIGEYKGGYPEWSKAQTATP